MSTPSNEILLGVRLKKLVVTTAVTAKASLTEVTTPVNVHGLQAMLIDYNRSARDTLVRGFRYGFRIGFNGHNSTIVSKNDNSASRHNIACHSIIKDELNASRLAGPFINSPFKEYYISPIGIIPKKDKGKYRLIHDLSFLRGSSVNDGIPLDIRSVNYEPFDNAISHIVSQGSGATV